MLSPLRKVEKSVKSLFDLLMCYHAVAPQVINYILEVKNHQYNVTAGVHSVAAL